MVVYKGPGSCGWSAIANIAYGLKMPKGCLATNAMPSHGSEALGNVWASLRWQNDPRVILSHRKTRQRLALVSSHGSRPRWSVFLDEPPASLDPGAHFRSRADLLQRFHR
jgi:hypothetical protein